MFRLSGFKYSIGKKKSPIINFHSPNESINVIVGDNGEGKTLLLKTLAGQNSILEGEIFYGDKNINLRDLPLAYCSVSEYHHYYMKISEYFDYLISNFSLKKNVVDHLIEKFGLVNHINTKISNLSDGEKRRLSIVETELMASPIAFYDEPESNLDANYRSIWLDHIKKNELKNIKVIISHYPEIYKDLVFKFYRLNLHEFKSYAVNEFFSINAEGRCF